MFFTAMAAWIIAWYFVEKIHSDILNKFLKYLSIVLAGYLLLQLFL
jgi:hypothetical protein